LFRKREVEKERDRQRKIEKVRERENMSRERLIREGILIECVIRPSSGSTPPLVGGHGLRQSCGS